MNVAISMRLSPSTEYHEERDAISHDWINYLSQFGITPILIPNSINDPNDFLQAVNASHLLLTGGDSLGPLEFESERPVASIRDRNEMRLLKIAIDRNMPVMGVCRGLQLINIYFGGGITRNIKNHTSDTHTVNLLDNNSIIKVNSFHNDGVLLPQLSSALVAFALSEDDVVEGINHKTENITAIQWHPERKNYCSDFDKRMIKKWLSK